MPTSSNTDTFLTESSSDTDQFLQLHKHLSRSVANTHGTRLWSQTQRTKHCQQSNKRYTQHLKERINILNPRFGSSGEPCVMPPGAELQAYCKASCSQAVRIEEAMHISAWWTPLMSVYIATILEKLRRRRFTPPISDYPQPCTLLTTKP